MEAPALPNAVGREERVVQAVASGRSVKTEVESSPPATMSACTELKGQAGLTPVLGRAAHAGKDLVFGSCGSSSTKPFTL